MEWKLWLEVGGMGGGEGGEGLRVRTVLFHEKKREG